MTKLTHDGDRTADIEADILAGGHFTCDQASKKPVLVRAVYSNGHTGKFTVRCDSKTVYVHHGSLGDPNVVINLPLVVNLPFSPIEVFAWVSYAK